MDAELKAKWVEALRSGRYLQGKGSLRTDSVDGTEYCCLGVLAELAGDLFEGDPNRRESPDRDVRDYWEAGKEVLPNSLLVKYGLTQDQQVALINMNDGAWNVALINMNDDAWNFVENIPRRSFDHIAGYVQTAL